MTNKCPRIFVAICAWTALAGAVFAQADSQPAALGKTRNVVLIVSDGLRWQEIFTGADPVILNAKDNGMWDKPEQIKKEFWRDDLNERRAALFPFIWGVIAKRGQIFGNQNKGSVARVTNGKAFSYPGYNEMLTGAPDPKIDSNEFGPNPNVTVFEWLNKSPDLQGKVAVFATWNTFKDIFNINRSHLPIQAGWDEPYRAPFTPRQELLVQLYRSTTRLDDEDLYDSFLQPPLIDYVKSSHPRVIFVGYGETDNWAHGGRYDLVLHSAHEFDRFVQELWETMQALPEYRDQTTFILTADHGRGSGTTDWREHGVEHKGSENIWIAVMGPDTEPLGERAQAVPVTQSQIAATVSALVGKDYKLEVPAVAAPIADVLTKGRPTTSRP